MKACQYFYFVSALPVLLNMYTDKDSNLISDVICSINNNIPVRIPSYPYVLVNRSVLCNCGIKAENNYLLESLAAYVMTQIQGCLCILW